VQEWRQQFQQLESVNLRYDNQVIVNPDMEGKPKQVVANAAAAKARAATAVKPAVLVTHIDAHDRSLLKPGLELSDNKLDPKPAAARKRRRVRGKKALGRRVRSASKRAARKHSSTVPKADAKKAAVVAKTIPKPSPLVPKPPAGSN
jgi:hypothetical protein